MIKTFSDIGITDCVTCENQKCTGIASTKNFGEDFNITISFDEENEKYLISGCTSSNTSCDNDFDKEFNTEEKAVEYLNNNFKNFRCF